MKILFCYGTRPEIIKLCLLIEKSLKEFEVVSVMTGQHTSLYEDVKELLPKVDYHIKTGKSGSLVSMYALMFKELDKIYAKEKPDLVVVQGDTNSALCATQAAFYNGIPVGHVEAGLRTYNLKAPFPEEFNRQVISKISALNWCPNENNAVNLRKEEVRGEIIVTGNPIVDLVMGKAGDKISESNKVVVTLHRRENKDKFISMLEQLNALAQSHPELELIFPAHPNPIIQEHLDLLKRKNIKVIEPMKYLDFLNLLAESKFIISDSGGLQEEAVCLNKKILICREATERPEVVEAGVGKVVDSDILNNIDWALSPLDTEKIINPFGDGKACERIIASINEKNA